jgi:hypothetical protein
MTLASIFEVPLADDPTHRQLHLPSRRRERHLRRSITQSQQHRLRNLGDQRRHCGCQRHSPPEHVRTDCLCHQRTDLRWQRDWRHYPTKAYWLSQNTIGWDPLVAADEVYLHAAPTGGLVLDDTGISGGAVYTLTQNGVITGAIAAKFPHLAGLAAWELDPADAALLPTSLPVKLPSRLLPATHW